MKNTILIIFVILAFMLSFCSQKNEDSSNKKEDKIEKPSTELKPSQKLRPRLKLKEGLRLDNETINLKKEIQPIHINKSKASEKTGTINKKNIDADKAILKENVKEKVKENNSK